MTTHTNTSIYDLAGELDRLCPDQADLATSGNGQQDTVGTNMMIGGLALDGTVPEETLGTAYSRSTPTMLSPPYWR